MVAHASSLALGSADAEEGVGAPELVAGVGLDGDALLADGVAVLLDVVAGVEPREGEVAVGAAFELTRVDVCDIPTLLSGPVGQVEQCWAAVLYQASGLYLEGL